MKFSPRFSFNFILISFFYCYCTDYVPTPASQNISTKALTVSGIFDLSAGDFFLSFFFSGLHNFHRLGCYMFQNLTGFNNEVFKRFYSWLFLVLDE